MKKTITLIFITYMTILFSGCGGLSKQEQLKIEKERQLRYEKIKKLKEKRLADEKARQERQRLAQIEAKKLEEKRLVEEKDKQESTIEAIGYGNTKDEALKNAFSSAVSEYVGVVVDSKEVIKNGELIEDKILTFSNGYIDSYKTISSKEQMGLWEVSIKAVVKKQEVLLEVKKLKIKAKDIKGSEDRYARLVSQVKSKFDAEDLLADLIKETATVDFTKYIKIKLNNIEIIEDEATRTTVPVKINYEIYFDWKGYDYIVKKYKRLFKGIGGKLVEEIDIKKENIEYRPYFFDGKNRILLTKRINNKSIMEVWEFPKSYKMIYPFSKRDSGLHYYQVENKNIFLYNHKEKVEKILNPKFLFLDKEGKYIVKPKKVQLYQESTTKDDISTSINWYLKEPLIFDLDYSYDRSATLAIRPTTIAYPCCGRYYLSGLPINNYILHKGIDTINFKLRDIKNLKQIKLIWNNNAL